MTEYTEIQKWIAITAIMKTSSKVKLLPKEMVDYLFTNLRREFAPNLSDEQIKGIDNFVNTTAKQVQDKSWKTATKMLAKGDQKEAITKVKEILGKEDAEEIEKILHK